MQKQQKTPNQSQREINLVLEFQTPVEYLKQTNSQPSKDPENKNTA